MSDQESPAALLGHLQEQLRLQPKVTQRVATGEACQCPICTNTFEDPRFLNCGHTFCLACLKKWSRDCPDKEVKGKPLIKCPIDNIIRPLPEEGVKGLPKNFELVAAISAFIPAQTPLFEEEGNREHGQCPACLLPRILQVCEHCSTNMCVDCRQIHYDEFKIQMQKWRQELKRSSASLEISLRSEQDANAEENKRHAERMKQKISDFTTRALEQVTVAILKRNEQLCFEVDKKALELSKQRDATRSEQALLLKSTKEKTQYIDQLCQGDEFIPLNRESMDVMQAEIKTLCTRLASCSEAKTSTEQRWELLPDTLVMNQAVKRFCQEIEDCLPMDLIGTHTTRIDQLKPGSSQTGSEGSSKPFINERADRWTLFSREKDLEDPCGIAVAPTRDIYIADKKANQVKIFDEDHKLKQKLGCSTELNQPVDLVLMSDGSLLVVNKVGHHIAIFDKDGRYEKREGKRGETAGCFNEPVGITEDRNTGHIFVCENRNDRVQEFTRDLKPVADSGLAKRSFRKPMDIDIQDGVAAITCVQQNCVEVVFTNGGQIVTIHDEVIRSPLGVVLRKDANSVHIYVCCNPNILVYTVVLGSHPSFRLQEIIECPFPESRPKSIALLSRFKALVSLVGNEQLYVVDIH